MDDTIIVSPCYMAILRKHVYGRDMILNLASVVEMQVITAKNKQQFDIDIANENTKQVGFEY